MLAARRKAAPYVGEFIGTFFLVLTIGLTALQKQPLAPVSVGFMLAALVSTSGGASGGHFNPAITAGVWLSSRGTIEVKQAWGYVAAQSSGALLAAVVYSILLGETFAPLPGTGYPWTAAALVEVLYSAALAFTFLSTATLSRETKSPFQDDYAGLAVGLSFLAAASACGPISGCCLNPALAVATLTTDAVVRGGLQLSMNLKLLPLYMLCPLLGSLMAAAFFQLVRPLENDSAILKVEQEYQEGNASSAKAQERSLFQRTRYMGSGP